MNKEYAQNNNYIQKYPGCRTLSKWSFCNTQVKKKAQYNSDFFFH